MGKERKKKKPYLLIYKCSHFRDIPKFQTSRPTCLDVNWQFLSIIHTRGSWTCPPAADQHLTPQHVNWSPSSSSYLVPLHLLPEQHVIFQESSLQTDKMLELQTGDGIEEGPSEQEDLFGGSHPQAFSLQGSTREMGVKTQEGWENSSREDDRPQVTLGKTIALQAQLRFRLMPGMR